jgi:Zn finger protein HypA/HybF involved in hydrogenase expression
MVSTSYSAAQKCACGSTNCTLHESELICDDCGAKVKTEIDNDEAYKV